MATTHRALALAGYDPEVARALGPSSARRLAWLAYTSALPCVLIGASAGYAAHLVEHSLALAGAIAVVFGVFVLNLLRVSVAGGGMALHKSRVQAERFRPALPPLLVVSLLSGLFAQPAMLPLLAAEHDPFVAAHRVLLLREHHAMPRPERVRAGTVANRLREERAQRYGRNVAAASFAAKRVTLAWAAPLRASALTLLFVLACVLPLLLARVPLVGVVRHYELVRRQRLEELLHALQVVADREVVQALSRWPSYVPSPERAAYADGAAS